MTRYPICREVEPCADDATTCVFCGEAIEGHAEPDDDPTPEYFEQRASDDMNRARRDYFD